MGWTFRKRVKLGPINVNLSRSGVGLSAGAGPFRAGVDAKGRKYTSIRGPFGLSNRQYNTANRRDSLAKNPSASAAKEAFWVLILSAVSLVIYFDGGVKLENQVWVIVFALLTGIPAVLALYGYFSGKDANARWFPVVAAVLKIEKWVAFGFLLLLLTLAAGSGGKKRR